jgi:two-component system cell cycle response regulator DivK
MLKEPILIVDDNPLNLKLERLLLEVEGYQVQIAKSAEDALKTLESFHPRLILLDFGLPGMDGLAMTRKLKAKAETRDIIILIVTSYDQKGDEARAKEAGCDGYLHKPLDTKTFPVLVAEYLRRATSGSGQSGNN